MANNKRWTDNDIATLKQIVSHFDVQKRGFETAAKALNRTVSACQAKYVEIHKSTRHDDLEATKKILYENIAKNPGNLREAFRITSNALNTAKTNAESDLMEVDDQMSSVLETLKDKDVTPNEVINRLAELINRKKEIEEGIANIELVDKYINEEIDV